MPSIKYDPEIIDSKLGDRKINYPMTIEPLTTIRNLSIAFDLQVIFQAKEISTNFGNDKYYIGIRNAVIEINAEGGKCTHATKDSFFSVDYAVDSSKKKEVKEIDKAESQLSFTPTVIKLGQEYSLSEVEEKKTSGQFNKNEKQLASKSLNNWAQWIYSLPNNSSLTSDVLDEILTLQASFQWNLQPLKGVIKLKPGRVEIFDAERKRFPRRRGLAMIKLLIHKHILIHKENIEIKYEVY